MATMKKIYLLAIFALTLSASSPFDTKEPKKFDLSAFNTTVIDAQIAPNKKIRCRIVCDKKLYKQELLNSAISFYKNSKFYTFTRY